jgi:hypothetical protein
MAMANEAIDTLTGTADRSRELRGLQGFTP